MSIYKSEEKTDKPDDVIEKSAKKNKELIMDKCMRKNCNADAVEEDFCSKHYNEIAKKFIAKEDDKKTQTVKETTKDFVEEAVSKKSYVALSVFAHIDKFSKSLINSFNNMFSLGKEETADIYRQIGSGFVDRADTKKAIPLLKKVVELNPEDVDAKYNLGKAYEAESQYDLAIICFEEAIALDPKHSGCLLGIGHTYENKNMNGKAITAYKKAVRLNPEDGEIHYRLGVLFDGNEKYKEAVIAFKKAIELDPDHATYHQSLGLTYESLDKHDEAIKCYKKVLTIQQGG